MRKALFVFALITISTTASAQMLRYDVEAYCRQVAGAGASYSNMIYNGCFDMEQTSYNNLKSRWGSISNIIKSYCDNVARAGGGGSYMILEGCIQMEQSAGSQDNTFKY